MIKVAVIYHSGYGHTAKVAQAVGEGARGYKGTQVDVISVDALDANGWATLDAADAIIFGAPTYMGSASAQFKAFMDSTSKHWFAQRWKDKIAAGFTNSGLYSGDKLNTLFQLMLNAMQHGMIWVGNGAPPASTKGGQGPDENAINRLGSSIGVETQSHNGSPEVTPGAGDLETARLLGLRVAEITAQFARGA